MTFHTVGDIEESFFIVFVLHLNRIMAGIAGVLDVSGYMTGFASDHPFAAMIEGESVGFQTGWDPGRRAMAIFALHAEYSSVDGGFRVAGDTFGGRSRKLLIHVADRTFDFDVASVQDKELGVVKVVHPVYAIMTS